MVIGGIVGDSVGVEGGGVVGGRGNVGNAVGVGTSMCEEEGCASIGKTIGVLLIGFGVKVPQETRRTIGKIQKQGCGVNFIVIAKIPLLCRLFSILGFGFGR